jgi:DNA phosphorothioation-associated putative methyltransferase
VTGTDGWDEIRKQRTEDLSVYLALARFRKRPPISKYPMAIQHDIREFFSTYKRACEQADEMLFQSGKAERIDEACKRSRLVKLLPNALYVHKSAVESLEPILRIYEGCSRA